MRQLRDSHILDLLITFAGSVEDAWVKQWNLVLLEIFYLLFCPFEVSDLFETLRKSKEERQLVSENSSASQTQATDSPISVKSVKPAIVKPRNPRFKGVYSVFVGVLFFP
jgi:hypothetical protein